MKLIFNNIHRDVTIRNVSLKVYLTLQYFIELIVLLALSNEETLLPIINRIYHLTLPIFTNGLSIVWINSFTAQTKIMDTTKHTSRRRW